MASTPGPVKSPDVQTLAIDGAVELDAVSGRLPDAPPTRLGPRARIRSGTVIYRGSVIGAGLETGHGVVIREENRIGENFSIWNHATVDYGCRIGDGVKIHCNVYLAQYSELEDGVFVGPNSVFANDLIPGQEVSREHMRGPTIRRGAQIGAGCVVLPYVVVGAGALIGAGSVVTRHIPAGMAAAGNPARIIRPVSELERRLSREGVWMPATAEIPDRI
jgi:acetyltransferase-like isoleucine patch superfamily enzyme